VIVIGVDPGSVFTGAAVHQNGSFTFWAESDDPIVIWKLIRAVRRNNPGVPLVVILEDFLGSGPRNKHAKRTIEVIGYIRYTCIAHGIGVELVPQQYRKSNVMNVPTAIEGKDEKAAAAHVLSYIERKARGI